MKRKTLAILLSALLVVSALFVLVACNHGETTTEYVITFRDYNSKILFQGQTVDGVIVQDKTLAREGYTFDGWYKNLSADKDGNLVYENKVTIFGTKFTADTELYAKWNANEISGEGEGYCLIGKVNGVANWDEKDLNNLWKWKMTHDKEHPSLYTFTTDVKIGDGFKVKTFYPDWDTMEINYGSDKLTEVKLADGVKLPTGVENEKALFGTDNIQPLYDMNITIEFHYAGKNDSSITITVNSFKTAEEPAV